MLTINVLTFSCKSDSTAKFSVMFANMHICDCTSIAQVTSPDIKQYCKAKLFDTVGKRTQLAVRFSTVGGESGSADTARDPRGFAVKFYTEEGNW